MKILFVSHSAARSGAPILLLHLMRWLKANTDWSLEILLLRGGPLEDEFLKVAEPAKFSRSVGAVDVSGRILARLNSNEPRLKKLSKAGGFFRLMANIYSRRFKTESKGGKYDLIYANTAATGYALQLLSRFDCPVVTHIHELEYALGLLEESWKIVRLETDRYIAVSQAVKTNLEVKNHIPAERIDVVYGFVEANRTPEEDRAARQRIRAQLGVPEDAFVVGAAGTLEWRKGSDLFLELAKIARGTSAEEHSAKSPYFVWVGGNLDSAYGKQLLRDTEESGLGEQLRWLG
jgi:glycosyltransferase involved in cell wall biosynthesis